MWLRSVLFAAMTLLCSCKENIDMSMRYVFRENTVLGYLEKHSEYSEYYRLLGLVRVSSISNTTVKQLLSARGNYTVFAPTNEAIQHYLDTLVVQEVINRPSWDAFTDSVSLDSIRRVIVHNSIIDGGDDIRFCTGDFPLISGADITLPNMYDRKVTVTYDDSIPEAVGYMKNVALMATSTGGTISQRTADNCIRRIILRATLDPDETYYLRFKGVLDDQYKFLFFDYMEYCPKEVYDNPETPEDIW